MSTNNNTVSGGFRGSSVQDDSTPPSTPQQTIVQNRIGGPGGAGGGPAGPGGAGGPGVVMIGGSVSKPKDSKKTWSQIFGFAKRYIPAIVFALLFGVISSAAQVYGPELFRHLTNEISTGLTNEMNMLEVERLSKLLILFYVASSLLNYIQSFIMGTITANMGKTLRSEISSKINRIPLGYFDKTTIGDTLSRITNDVDTIGQTLNNSIAELVRSAITLVGVLFMMFWTNLTLAIVAIISSAIGALLSRVFIKKAQKYVYANTQLLGQMSGHIEEVYTGHNIVKAYNASKAARKEFDEINNDMITSGWKSQFISGMMMPVMSFVGNLGYVMVCVVGAVMVLQGKIDFGVIIAFTMYIRQFSQPINQIANSVNSLQRTAASGERVFDLLHEDELSDESAISQKLDNVRGDVEFTNVNFRYLPDIPIINDFSAKVKAGQKIAIVGPTGAGKTTLVNLLMRFYELNSGEITIDGISINELTRKNIRELFCMVLQDTWLFNGTIRENIVYNKEKVSDQDVETACRAVGIHHFIMTLPDGYDTILDENTTISTGQKQLLTVARAMIVNAPLLILDEATSSVDTRTEVIVQEAMDKLMEGRTSFVIAHRLSTIRNADIILVMRDGDIVESGNHEELLARGGYYYDLYNSQFEKAA
ncbi:MAG: ABC transporter ATP-binding protein/permease [Oscillospiraceae bacterium]|nr:ABC transporter ATP-binding protein/permease [Oscillospiraceae bacterium]